MASPSAVTACSQPDPSAISAAFDLTGNSLLPATVPQYSSAGAVHGIPASLLKAVGWVESGWHQFDSSGKPLVAPDFGYGIMQITSGMPGAFGNVRGTMAPASQSRVASDYIFNIAYGAKMLVDKWNSTPRIGNADPSVLENWYFALWAYNGWGWVNNPNNPRFSHVGTPAQNPDTFPYQERVLYLVQHPPRDSAGNPRWKPIEVALPSKSVIGKSPHSFSPKVSHSQPVQPLDAVYKSSPALSALPNSTVSVPVRVENTGTLPWPSTGTLAISLTYHLMTAEGNPWAAITPFSQGVVSFAQGQTVLPKDLLPGKSVSFRIPVHVPASAGAYQLVWDLQQGSNTWFSQNGVLPFATRLHVRMSLPVTPTPASTPPPTVTKVENAEYVRDTSVPDGTVLTSRQAFDKGWLMFNDGKTAWGTGWSFRHVSGSTFGLKTAPVPATDPCRSLNFVATLHAPKKVGAYTGVWRLYDSKNTAVGDRLTVVITVHGTPGNATPTPSPLPSPTAVGHTPPTPTATPIG